VKLVLPSIFVQLHPKDQAYFRQSREAYLGMTIEALAARREEFVPAFKAALIPLRTTLRAQPFLAGDGPMFADHIVFGALQWARLASAVPLLELDDPIWAWMESLIDAYAIR
jgi:glutathione S-transferase